MKQTKQRFLAPDEISPVVEGTSCHKLEKNLWFRYRIPSHHWLLIESGRIEARTPKGTFHAKAGDLLSFEATNWNEYGNVGPTLFYQAHINFAPPPRQHLIPSFAECGPLPMHIPLGKAFSEMRRGFETLCIEIPQSGTVHLLRMRATVHEMLAILANVLTRDRSGWQSLDEWQRLRMRLDSELNTEFSVETMARQMNLSCSYFKHAFKQHFGVSPKTYHTHARVREAARLLRSTDKSVKAVASELGFHDASTFTRLFKSQLRVLPSDIRQGTVRVDEIAPSATDRLFPMNIFLVPPRLAKGDWLKPYIPRKHGRNYKMFEEWKPKPH